MGTIPFLQEILTFVKKSLSMLISEEFLEEKGDYSLNSFPSQAFLDRVADHTRDPAQCSAAANALDKSLLGTNQLCQPSTAL